VAAAEASAADRATRYNFPMNHPSNRRPAAPILGLLSAMLLSSAALAAPPDTPLGQLLACRHVAAGAERLACFDRTSAALVRTPEPSPAEAPPPSATPAMKEALDPQRTFGLPHATIVRREAAAAGLQVKEAANITAHIVGLGHDPDGRAIITLDNGQVWKQLVADGTDLYTKPGDSVQISRGWLGSYWLEAVSHHGCKVTRLR
jgi:hypothetical protein